MKIKNNKAEVLLKLEELRKGVFDYADYNHYSKYDYNVELTLTKLDEVMEALSTSNEKYGVNHIINSCGRSENDPVTLWNKSKIKHNL